MGSKILLTWLSWLVASLCFGALAPATDQPTSYRSNFDGQRTWVGPDYWTVRWQDWSVADGRLSVEARPDRSAILLTHEVAAGDGVLEASVEITADANVSTAAGFWLGVHGPVDDWRSAGVYSEYRAFAGVRPDGAIVIRDRKHTVNSTVSTNLDMKRPFRLQVVARSAGEHVVIHARAVQADSDAGQAELRLPASHVVGLVGMGTAAQIGEAPPAAAAVARWHLRDFTLSGDRLLFHPDRTFGPIGWTQYTLSHGILKLTALMMPVGATENQTVELQLDRGDGFKTIAKRTMDPLSRSVHFRVESVDVVTPTPYRVRYEWNGREYLFPGTLRSAPNGPVKVAVLNCDRGYVFPNAPITAHVRYINPDLVLYLGDQIYEQHGKFGIQRKPLEQSCLDYLRKYAIFGFANRDILRDVPSIIIPDDHDVFQGNLWGAAGRAQPKGGDEMGGYQGEPDWINVVQRTQSWHLPDPYDPTPVERGIGVYYNQFTLGGTSFAVFEDRKWKTGYRSIWPDARAIPHDDLKAIDAPGAVLLGDRQERFLAEWAKSDPERIKVAISQTMFAKAHTHTGPELKRNALDFDTNGWPQTPRNRAVAILGQARALHIVGDQHLGILAQLGVENWSDGPLTFMATGIANGWPRAWWPETAGEARRPGDPEYTGRYRDVFGNQMTILGVANPEPGSNRLTAETHTPYEIAEAKASGFGVVRIDPATQRATFEMWRFTFDPANPAAARQFETFPQTYRRGANGWTRVDR